MIRGSDTFGAGYFKAPRGKRTHNGVDPVTTTGAAFRSFNDGVVTKLGYPYADDLHYRYVQVTHADGSAWRYFYILPTVTMGQHIKTGDPLGTCQSLEPRYPGITQHVHFEVMRNGAYIDPTNLVIEWA